MPALAVTSWRTHVRHVVNTTLDFFLPPVCASCQRVGSLFCEACQAALPWIPTPICDHCGRPCAQARATCARCRGRLSALVQVRAAVAYSGPVPPAIHAMKYEGYFAVAAPLAQLMVEVWPAWPAPADIVVPVPLHPERQRERGYNQSQLLTAHLCQSLALTVEADGLKRLRHTRPQVGLSGKDRLNNVDGAFGAVRERVAGKRVLLVDDVFTTGATLGAAASALLLAGASSVSAYCLARALDS